MSVLSIRPYLPFCRVRIVGQSVSAREEIAWIKAEPDARYCPVCHVCGQAAAGVHSWDRRLLRDLNLGAARVWINCRYRKIRCRRCRSFRVEDLEFFDPYQRVTRRLARYIYELCKVLNIQEVADHFALDWKTVKRVDQTFLEQAFHRTDYDGLRILAVDEVAVKKGHNYMTVVLDHETGRVVWLGKARTAETLEAFFDGMTTEQKAAIEAVAMDTWDPYIKAVRKHVPHAKIVFDMFHVVQAFGRVIDKVRRSEYHKASGGDKEVFKGARYLLLANRKNIRRPKARAHLNKLLALNETLSTVMILKDLLKTIWRYRSRWWAERRLREWCILARTVDHPDVQKFARTLERYQYGLLNHCDYPIHTGRIEGVNNTIKVIKRKAYGFHDERYFSLKVIQAFATN